MGKSHEGERSRKSFDGLSFGVGVLGLVVAVWSAYEAHSARIEARSAIDAAQRSANAAEESNTLAARSQSSYLVPAISTGDHGATVTVKNVSANVALDIQSGYFLYAGPLKSVSDVSTRLTKLPLRPLALALGATGEATVIDSVVSDTSNEAPQSIVVRPAVTTYFEVPVVKVDSPFGIPHLEMERHSVTVPEVRTQKPAPPPSQTLVIGLVSFHDSANVQHRLTYCFPLNKSLAAGECSSLNSLELNGSAKHQVN